MTDNAQKDNLVIIKRISRKPAVIAVLILAAVAAAGLLVFFHLPYRSYHVSSSIPRADENTMTYFPFQNGIVKYNVTGITHEDREGNIIWTEALTMQNPKVVSCGDYVAMADSGQNQYILFDSSRKIGAFTTDYPITDIQVASQGMVCVVQEDEKTNYITSFDKNGSKIVEIKTTISKNGYPIAIAMSDDGEKLAASYVTFHGLSEVSSITFYNFSAVGQNEVDRQVGYKKFNDELIPRLQFVNNNTVAAFGSEHLMIYSMRQKPEQLMKKKLKGEALSVFANEKYVGYICDTRERAASSDATETSVSEPGEDSGNHRYRVCGYNLQGRLIMDETFRHNYDSVHSTAHRLIIVSGGRLLMMTPGGHRLYDKKLTDNVVDLFPTSQHNRYVLITEDKTRNISFSRFK